MMDILKRVFGVLLLLLCLIFVGLTAMSAVSSSNLTQKGVSVLLCAVATLVIGKVGLGLVRAEKMQV